MTNRLLLRGGHVITMDPQIGDLIKGDVLIEDDEIVAILYRHRAELLARAPGTPQQALPPTEAAPSVSGSSTLPEATPAAVEAVAPQYGDRSPVHGR